MCVLRFDERLRNLSGQDFAELLATQLHSHLVVVGHDFRFGRNGEATAAALAAGGQALGFEVDVVPPVLLGGARSAAAVCVRRLREAILSSRALARAPVFDDGPRGPGQPTRAEVGLSDREPAKLPAAGAAGRHIRRACAWRGRQRHCRVLQAWEHARLLRAAARRCSRRTCSILPADLYGREIEVEFVAKLREEERFADLDALVVR